MKALLFICCLLLLACIQPESRATANKNEDTTKPRTQVQVVLPKKKADRAKYHTVYDIVYIFSSSGDTLIYTKEEFNDIVDNFPELTSDNTLNPDTAYNSGKNWVDLVDSNGNKKHLTFGSEAGQDEYYVLYAYFLKQKNGIKKYRVKREKLQKIYRTLNELFGSLTYGGTYYGHEYSRIEGYAEFSVYWFQRYQDFFDRPYDITKQKSFYIGGLKQLVEDEVGIDNYVNGVKEKERRRADLIVRVDSLNALITDNFYLRMAQSFQSEHY